MYISNVNDCSAKNSNLTVENKIQYTFNAVKEEFTGVKRKASSSLLLGGYITPRKTSSMNFNFVGLIEPFEKVEWFEEKAYEEENVFSWLKN